MKKSLKNGIICISIIIILVITILLVKLNKKEETTPTEGTNKSLEENIVQDKEENIMIINVGRNEIQEEIQKPEPEPEKDAATLTQEIYNINGPIGTIYIPKTRVKYANL